MIFNKKPFVTKKLDYNRPVIVLNFKTYKESTGDNAVKLALIAEKIQEKTGLNIMICCQAIDLKNVASSVTIPVYAQHVDAQQIGQSTGSIIPEHLLNINVRGSLLNHSEYRIPAKVAEKTILKLKELDMVSVVCAKDNAEVKKFSTFKPIKPTFIAVEPPELIGGEVSVSQAKPDIIQKSVKACGNAPLLIGAGIKDSYDVKIALQYGAKGVLLSSHFVLARDPEKFLLELIKDII